MTMKIKPPVMEFTKDSHCSYCGTRFTEQTAWPRKCFFCYNESYKNPIPIVVSMIGTEIDHKMALLIQQRNIEPKKGEWAFPSGYIDHGESWEEAAVRENWEEMQFKSVIDDYHFFDIQKPPSGNMLIFCTSFVQDSNVLMRLLKDFQPNEEVMGASFWYGNTELAFPTHNECGQKFLARLRNTQSPWNY